MEYINNLVKKRDKVSIAYYILHFFCVLGAPQGSILCLPFFLIYIKKPTKSTVEQLVHNILFFIAHNAKT